jgi:dihydropteroate synthase
LFNWDSLLKPGPCFIGILNCTPDSFSDGGRFREPIPALRQALHLVAEGAKVIDVGAESTRPGSIPIEPEEEWDRLHEVLSLLRQELPSKILLSIDTKNISTAQRAVDIGVTIVNDVTGFSNPQMLALLDDKSIGAIAMRSTVVNHRLFMPKYGDSRVDLQGKLAELLNVITRMKETSVSPQQCLVDIGFGFGTTFSEDAALWDYLMHDKSSFGWPHNRFCIGISRKRFLAWRTHQPDLPPHQRDHLTHESISELMGVGYQFFRVHNVPRYA